MLNPFVCSTRATPAPILRALPVINTHLVFPLVNVASFVALFT